MTPLPELDVSTQAAARKSLQDLRKWLGRNVLEYHTITLAERAKLMIDNMRFMNAQQSLVMRAKAETAIAAVPRSPPSRGITEDLGSPLTHDQIR